MNFRLTKGNFLKTGAYIEGDSAVFTFAAEKEDAIELFFKLFMYNSVKLLIISPQTIIIFFSPYVGLHAPDSRLRYYHQEYLSSRHFPLLSHNDHQSSHRDI